MVAINRSAQLTDTPECREAVGETRAFMLKLLAGCGLHGSAAEQAVRMIWSLARGFVIHELTDPFLDPTSHDEAYEYALMVFVSGLSSCAKMGEPERTSSFSPALPHGIGAMHRTKFAYYERLGNF